MENVDGKFSFYIMLLFYFSPALNDVNVCFHGVHMAVSKNIPDVSENFMCRLSFCENI